MYVYTHTHTHTQINTGKSSLGGLDPWMIGRIADRKRSSLSLDDSNHQVKPEIIRTLGRVTWMKWEEAPVNIIIIIIIIIIIRIFTL